MNNIYSIIGASFGTLIIITIIFIIIIWNLIKSAISAGVREGIKDAFYEIREIKDKTPNNNENFKNDNIF